MAENLESSGPNVLPSVDILDEVSESKLLPSGDSVPVKPNVLSIQDLPKEVRGKIFNYVPQKEILEVRLVCKQWDRDVEGYYLYRITALDESSPKFGAQVKQRINHLDILRLESKAVMNPDGTCIFGYPNIITSLVISDRPSESLGVSPSNFQSLLGLLSQTLRSLDVALTPEIYNHEYPSDLSFDFQALTQLKVGWGEHLLSLVSLTNLSGVFRVLENSNFPKLKAYKVLLCFPLMQKEVGSAIQSSILKLIGANGKFLESLQLPTMELSTSDLAGLMSITQLKKFEGKLGGVGLPPSWDWNEFLSSQNKLENVSLDLGNLTDQDFLTKYLVPDKVAGLVCINLDGLLLRASLDLSIFAGCEHLKALVLDAEGKEKGHLFNFHRLPPTITHIKMWNFVVSSSEELLAAFNLPGDEGVGVGSTGDEADVAIGIKGFPKLQTFHLLCDNQVGVTPEVLEKVIGSKSLLNLLIGVFPRGGEGLDLGPICTKLNLPDALTMLWIRRCLPTAEWKFTTRLDIALESLKGDDLNNCKYAGSMFWYI